MRPSRPIGRYHGGKWRIADWTIGHFPSHEIYVEAFGGMGSVLLKKEPSRIEVYNDLDERVVTLFRVLRDTVKSEQLRRAVDLTLFSRREHSDAWEPCEDEIEACRRFIVVMFQSIGAKDIKSRSGWRTRTSKAVWSPCTAWNSWPPQVPLMCRRLKDTIIECLPWERICDIYDAPEALFYVDPPYLSEVRDPGHRRIYKHEMGSLAEHRVLLERLREMEAMVIVAGYRHPLYDEMLEGWAVDTIEARAQCNAPRVEALWVNPAAQDRGLFSVRHS